MILFSGNLNHPLNAMTDECQMRFLAATLAQFRELPLCNKYGYDEEGLRFYDGVLGNLIRTRDSFLENDVYDNVDGFSGFSSHWVYRGNIYRIIAKSYVMVDGSEEPCLRMPEIKWHGMVASWSKTFDFTRGFNHVKPGEPYTFIWGNTKNSAGIDVNLLGDYLGSHSPYTDEEQEVIFPMRKDCVIGVFKDITPSEFKAIMEEKSRGQFPAL